MEEKKNELPTPLKDCRYCQFAKICEDYEDGRCYLRERLGRSDGGAKLHECYGIALTQDGWASFLGVTKGTVSVALTTSSLEELFDRCARKAYSQIHAPQKPKADVKLTAGRMPKVHEFFGEAHTAKEWAEILGLSLSAVTANVREGLFEKRYAKRFEKVRGVQ